MSNNNNSSKQYEPAVKDIERVDETLKFLNQNTLPDIFKRLNTIETKLATLLMLWSFNIVLLGIILNKVFK